MNDLNSPISRRDKQTASKNTNNPQHHQEYTNQNRKEISCYPIRIIIIKKTKIIDDWQKYKG